MFSLLDPVKVFTDETLPKHTKFHKISYKQ